jgi:hypothetical protein
MSRSGGKYRNPHVLDARKRKGTPHEAEKRRFAEELRQKELDEELQNMWPSRLTDLDGWRDET